MEIGDNIKKYRELKSLTLPALATAAGVSKAFLWEIESGKSKRPGAETLFRIAEALDVTIAHLMGKAGPADGGTWIEPEEVESLSFVQLKGGRPETKEQWAVVYGMLREMTGPHSGPDTDD